MLSLSETIRRVGLLLAVSLVAAAAAGAAAGPPTLAQACGPFSDVEAESSWVRTRDGIRLFTVQAGSDTTAVVLAHQGRSNLCETLTYVPTLIAAGFRVYAFDFRGHGKSELSSRNRLSLGTDLAAMVARARADGAEHVVLVGASLGGAAIVQNTAALDVDGRISLSGTAFFPGYGINRPDSLPRIRAPFLFLGSRNDRRVPVAEARGIFRRVGAKDKRIALYPGVWHGWQLVDSAPFAPQVRALIIDWIRRVT
jgi:alpha-beta hydrolase superfamily lysophospholipase